MTLFLSVLMYWGKGDASVLSVVSSLISESVWHIMSYIPSNLAAFVYILCFLNFKSLLPESPRWMLAKGKSDAAHDLLGMMARRNGKVLPPGITIDNQASTYIHSYLTILIHNMYVHQSSCIFRNYVLFIKLKYILICFTLSSKRPLFEFYLCLSSRLSSLKSSFFSFFLSILLYSHTEVDMVSCTSTNL